MLQALVQHHRAFYNQLSDQDPPMNASRWGFARYEDGIDGVQWLLDPTHGAQGSTPETAFLWELLGMLRTGSQAIMSAVSAQDGGGYTWETWFEKGDPFAKHNDAEKTGPGATQRG